MAHRAANRGLYPQLTPSAIAKIALFSRAHMAKQSAIGSPKISIINLNHKREVCFKFIDLPLISPVNGL